MTITQSTACGFRTTSWTLIAQAREGAGLTDLLERYWSPIYAYLRRAGKPEAEALDLTQGFLLSRLIEKQTLLDRADRDQGRFRSYLLTALKNFVCDQHRRAHPKSGPRFVPADSTVIAATEPATSDDPALAFNRQWATATFDGAIRQLETDCRAMGMDRQWRAFEARVLFPLTRGAEPIAVEFLIQELGARDRQQVYDMVETVKKRLQRTIREFVNEIVETEEDVESELNLLRAFAAG